MRADMKLLLCGSLECWFLCDVSLVRSWCWCVPALMQLLVTLWYVMCYFLSDWSKNSKTAASIRSHSYRKKNRKNAQTTKIKRQCTIKYQSVNLICIRQPKPIVTKPNICKNKKANTTLHNYYHTDRRKKRETKQLLEHDIILLPKFTSIFSSDFLKSWQS